MRSVVDGVGSGATPPGVDGDDYTNVGPAAAGDDAGDAADDDAVVVVFFVVGKKSVVGRVETPSTAGPAGPAGQSATVRGPL